MNIALATKGVIGGFIATGGGEGEPYPLPVEEMEVSTYDVKLPFIDADVEDDTLDPIGFNEVEEYLPVNRSTIETLPSAGLRVFPKPQNL